MFDVRLVAIGAGCLAFSFLGSDAQAQPKPTQTDQTLPVRIATYHAGITALTPAASATDFFTITGSATAVVRVKGLECTSNSTASGALPIQLVRRSTANTGGTATTRTALPSDTNDGAATATVQAYTANAATLGTLAASAVMRVELLYSMPVASAVIAASPAFGWQFGNQNDKEPVLRGINQVLALNALGASFPAGSSVNCTVEWTESLN